jgi:hypothetical protein
MTTVENPYEKIRNKMVTARIGFMGELAKFSREDLQKRPAEGEWCALELAYHLYITDGLALQHMQLVQSEDNPLIAAVEVEGPRLTRAAEVPASLDVILAGMAARREAIFQYLSTLPPEAWERQFRHHTSGLRKFYQLVNVLPAHDQLHTQQLAAIRDIQDTE